MRHSRLLPLNSNLIGKYGCDRDLTEIIRGIALGIRRADDAPTVDVIPVEDPSTYGGRYLPKYNAILLYGSHDHDLTRGVGVHEGGHWKTYCTECGTSRGNSSCGYRGDHDRTFYKNVGPLYRAFDIQPHIIKQVEAGYRYPKELVMR